MIIIHLRCTKRSRLRKDIEQLCAKTAANVRMLDQGTTEKRGEGYLLLLLQRRSSLPEALYRGLVDHPDVPDCSITFDVDDAFLETNKEFHQ